MSAYLLDLFPCQFHLSDALLTGQISLLGLFDFLFFVRSFTSCLVALDVCGVKDDVFNLNFKS
jgi:hypothetical protein